MLQDFHLTIKRYRMVYIGLILFVCFLTWDMWAWYKDNAKMIEYASAGAFSAAFIAMIGLVKYSLEGLHKDSGHD